MDDENELARQLAQALQAVQSRDDFIATAAHELRTPMNALALQIGLVDLLLKQGDLERGRTEVARAQRILQRFLLRATTLLDVSHLNQERPSLELEDFDLVDLLNEVTEDLTQDARARSVELVVDAPTRLPVRWNRHGAAIVLSNLLSNALRYAPGHPVRVTAGLAATDEVVLVVEDRGPGIAPSDRERVFAKFERLNAGAGNQGGFGLGLWIVGRVVAAHHGEISIGDVHGGGTRFEVKLPANPHSGSNTCPSLQ